VKGKFDIIVSNPPYLSKKELSLSDKELFYEPYKALVTREKGLYFYKRLAKQASFFLKEKGLVVIEISEKRVEEIKTLFLQKAFSFQGLLVDFLDYKRALVLEKIS
jgi:release factor glutamine methyltransferase